VEVAATDRELTVLAAGVPVAHHPLLPPAETSVDDAHYPTPPPSGARPLRPRTGAERASTSASTRPSRSPPPAARTAPSERSRATRFSRFARGDLETICDALAATPPEQMTGAAPLALAGLPHVPTRSISAYGAQRDGHAA
jgi:hypothetical protein